NTKAIQSLIENNLLRVTLDEEDRTTYVMAHSPLTYVAFEKLVNDEAFLKGMEKYSAEVQIEKAKKKIEAIEHELVQLRKAFVSGKAVKERTDVLFRQMEMLNAKVLKELERLP